MKLEKTLQQSVFSAMALLAALLLAGCQSSQEPSGSKVSTGPAPSAPAAAVAAAAVPKTTMPVHIKAGPGDSFTDADGNVWISEQGFVDGETAERPDVTIANTKTPAIYHSEHYSMSAFSWPVPNGKYIVKLHFCETYEGITGPGQRVFTFNVAGHEFKDFDVWVKAGGFLRAYVETVNVEVTNGKLDITFTPQVENPQINGIEIYPAS
jgi:hypothetical protein